MSGDVTLATPCLLQGLSGNNKVYDSTTGGHLTRVTASVTPLGSDNVTVSIPNGAPHAFLRCKTSTAATARRSRFRR
jgi:hypothetical protein